MMIERLRQTVLWTGAALGLLCLLWAAAVAVLGVKPLVFTSGSMSPEIAAGDLAFARTVPAGQLAVGDVVSVVNAAGSRVTHRVVTIDRVDDGGAVLALQGDANTAPDAEAYNVTTVERVDLSVPKAGYVLDALATPAGRFGAGAFTGLCLVLVLWGPRGRRPAGRVGGTRRGPRRLAQVTLVNAVVAAVLLTAGAAHVAVRAVLSTTAAFSDTATMTASHTAHTVVSQAQPACSTVSVLGLLDYARVTWSHVDTRYEYAYRIVRVSNGVVVGSGVVTPTGAAGSTVTLEVRSSLLDLGLGTFSLRLEISARLKGATSWTAAPTTTMLTTSSVVLGLAVRCA